jgi:hypothetical protein
MMQLGSSVLMPSTHGESSNQNHSLVLVLNIQILVVAPSCVQKCPNTHF